MLIITLAANGEPSEHVFGCIGCERITPVNDYQLVTAGANGDTAVTALLAYSRWTEEAFGLLARLLARHPRNSKMDVLGTRLCNSIYLGRNPETARLLEQVDASLMDGTLSVSFQDEFGRRVSTHPARDGYLHPFDLLIHAARLAVWGKDEEPPIPAPLTDVPVVVEEGLLAYVLARDMPALARRHFERRYIGRTVPRPGAFYANDWWSFIGGTK